MASSATALLVATGAGVGTVVAAWPTPLWPLKLILVIVMSCVYSTLDVSEINTVGKPMVDKMEGDRSR